MTWKRIDLLTPKQRLILRYAPFDVVAHSHALWRDPFDFYREHKTTIDPRSVFPVAMHDSLWLDLFDPQQRRLIVDPPPLRPVAGKRRRLRRASNPRRFAVRAAHPDAVDPPDGVPVAVPSEGSFNATTKMEPIFDPLHNMKAIGKELSLLEDHLVQPTRRCNDCIRKHLVRAEAFGEEGISLDVKGEHVEAFGQVLDEIRALQGPAMTPGVDRHQLGQRVRKVRKRVVRLGYLPKSGTSPQPDPVPELRGSRDRQIGAVAQPSVAETIPEVQIPGGGAALRPGQAVIYAYRPKGDLGPIESWSRGRVLPIGSRAGEYTVNSIPESGYVALETSDGTQTYWAYASETIPVSGGAPLSLEFGRFARIPRYSPRGTFRTPMDDQRLAMIDIIQSVLEQTIELPQPILGDVIRAAILNAAYESDLDPGAVGDEGRSVGLFQLHESGAGAGMSVALRKNPAANAMRIAAEYKARLSERAPLKPDKLEQARMAVGVPLLADLHAAALDGQRPSVGAWTAAWALQVERPHDPFDAAVNRKRTADELFPPSQKRLELVPPGAFAPSAPATPAVVDDGLDLRFVFGGAAVVAAAVAGAWLVARAGRTPSGVG